jgi:hypothetical protein
MSEWLPSRAVVDVDVQTGKRLCAAAKRPPGRYSHR